MSVLAQILVGVTAILVPTALGVVIGMWANRRMERDLRRYRFRQGGHRG